VQATDRMSLPQSNASILTRTRADQPKFLSCQCSLGARQGVAGFSIPIQLCLVLLFIQDSGSGLEALRDTDLKSSEACLQALYMSCALSAICSQFTQQHLILLLLSLRCLRPEAALLAVIS